MLSATCSISDAPTPINWQDSAKNMSSRFRESLFNRKPIDLNSLKAAIIILGKMLSMYGLFDPKMRDWCTKTQRLFKDAVAGKQIYFDREEAAYWFDLMSIYFA